MLLFTKYVLGLPDPVRDRGPFDSEDDEQDAHERKSRTDQVLYFFEYEAQRHEAYIAEDSEFEKELEELRIKYYNCVNGVEFQDEQLAILVDELIQLRQQFREAPKRQTQISIQHNKLDITDRKTTRFFKEKERRELAEKLAPMLADIKLKKFLDEEKYKAQEDEVCASLTSYSSGGEGGAQAVSSKSRTYEETVEGFATEMISSFSAGTTRRRKYKHYSDEELIALLREKDS